MSTTLMVQPHHLRRKAVLDIRHSPGHQVLTNLESPQLQHARRAHAHHLGWSEERLAVVETDMGRTAQSTERRDGSQALLAEVALGQVGRVPAIPGERQDPVTTTLSGLPFRKPPCENPLHTETIGGLWIRGCHVSCYPQRT